MVTQSFTPEEVAVYLDPHYLVNKAQKVVSVDDIKVTNADRKKTSARGSRRGQFGADFTEDDEWAEQVKKEKAKKLNEAMGVHSPEVEEAKRRTDEILSRVRVALQDTLFAFQCLSRLSLTSTALVARLCHQVVPSLMELAKSPLAGESALSCLYDLVFNLLDESLQHAKRYAHLDINHALILN